ncbi:MAG: NADPH-dependent F420 reductase [Bacteroidota bacterium]
MEIAILGTGRVGRVLGRRWAAAGHTVAFGSRTPGTAGNAELGALEGVSVMTPLEAVAGADIAVLATPWSAAEDVIASLDSLDGKILIDCTNPVGPNFTFEGKLGASGAERIAAKATGARVVKALNTTGAQNMAAPIVVGKNRLVMFICGDDDHAKQVVAGLVEQLGFEVADAGGLAQAYYLETLAMLWISQAFGRGWGSDFGFSILRRA